MEKDKVTFDIRKGCGKSMGDVKCGDIIDEYNSHRGIREIQVFYCKECS
ncbi:MAG: hypothetical protein ACLFUH_06940 [Bacteroidales bacterium]